jgi:hypothetical protein
MDRVFRNVGFRINLAAYVGVNLLLLVINLLTTPDHLWFYWPLVGWGIGIVAHGTAEHYAGAPRYRVRIAR